MIKLNQYAFNQRKDRQKSTDFRMQLDKLTKPGSQSTKDLWSDNKIGVIKPLYLSLKDNNKT